MTIPRFAMLAVLLAVWLPRIAASPACSPASAAVPQDRARSQSVQYDSIVLRGQVTELGPHLHRALNVPMDDDLGMKTLVLVTATGEVHPIIKDIRSRGYWVDKRLRDRPVELHVHRFPGVPFLRLIDAYGVKDGKRYKIDYWCEVCAITTYEPGPCPCCQDDIELRERLVDGNP